MSASVVPGPLRATSCFLFKHFVFYFIFGGSLPEGEKLKCAHQHVRWARPVVFYCRILIIFYFHFWRGGSTRGGEAEVFVSVRLLLHVFTKGGGSTSCFLFSIFHLRICFLFSFLGGVLPEVRGVLLAWVLEVRRDFSER